MITPNVCLDCIKKKLFVEGSKKVSTITYGDIGSYVLISMTEKSVPRLEEIIADEAVPETERESLKPLLTFLKTIEL